jgi:hypothetical protein
MCMLGLAQGEQMKRFFTLEPFRPESLLPYINYTIPPFLFLIPLHQAFSTCWRAAELLLIAPVLEVFTRPVKQPCKGMQLHADSSLA